MQTVLEVKDVPSGTVLIMFAQTLSGALLVSVGQVILTNELQNDLRKQLPQLDPKVIIEAGATAFRGFIDATDLPKAVQAYSDTLGKVFYVAVALSCLSIVGSLLVEWKSVKGKKVEMGGA